MTVKQATAPLRIPDPDEAFMFPGFLLIIIKLMVPASVGMQLRMLNHWTRVCLGEASQPAMGRGTSRRYSMRDATCLIVGLSLVNELHLAPAQTSYCVDTVRRHWSELFPGGYHQFYKQFPEIPQTWDPKILIATGRIPGQFEVEVIEAAELLKRMRAPSPAIVCNVADAIILATNGILKTLNDDRPQVLRWLEQL